MVLSLVDLSVRSVIKGMTDGTIQHPHLLSPMVRHRVLDMTIKEDLANHPNCLPLLTSVEFLNGMTTISAKARNDNDLEFLERLVVSLATKLPNGETVGAAVKKLNIKVYDYNWFGWNFKKEKTYWDVISKVYDLIGQCPNATSLDLFTRNTIATKRYWPLNENENIACNQVMENLINLSVVCNGDRADFIHRGRPIINFKKLKTLKLENCSFGNGDWPKLLEKIPLLENLHFFQINSGFGMNGLDYWILPSKLPHLKSLKVLGASIFECNKAFVDKLIECKQLRQVHLMLDQTSTDEESLLRLANMDIDLKMNIRLFVAGNDATDASILDSSSRFKLVRIFHEKIESCELDIQEWNAQFSTALEDMVKTCSNLTSFGIIQPYFRANQPQITCSEEKKRFNAELVRFFGIPQRAQQLEGLRLIGYFDETVLSVVFENCLNLVRLDICRCPELHDQHLIDWVSHGGGNLTHLIVEKCINVTSKGIIPILVKSADGLLRYIIADVGHDNNGRDWMKMLRNQCPNAVIGNYPILSIP